MLLWGGHYTRNISERCYYSSHYAVTLKVLAKMPSRRLCAVLLLFLLLCFVLSHHCILGQLIKLLPLNVYLH